MSASYWRSYRALGRYLIVCLALTASAHGQTVNNDAAAKGGTQTTKSAPAQDLTPALSAIQKGIEDISSAIETVGAESNSEANQKRETADLKAQQDMADWAGLMFGTSVFTALLTFAGVLLLGVTLAYTKYTLDEAGKTTVAARDTIDVNRDIGEAQTRAYLTVTQATVFLRTSRPTPHVIFKFQNTGNSPAITAKLFYFARYDGAFKRGQRDMIGPDATDIQDISPKEIGIFQHTFEDLNLSDPEIRLLTDGKPVELHLQIIIQYLDVFETTVSQRIQWNVTLPGALGNQAKFDRSLPAVSGLEISRKARRQDHGQREAGHRTTLQKLLGVFPK